MHIKDCLQKILDDIDRGEWMIKDEEVLERGVRECPDGLIMEFGVATGASFRRIAEATDRHCFGFDSFEGLPEDDIGWSKGAFACAVPKIERENANLVIGLIQDTLPGFLADNVGQAAFVHIDTDIYSSAKFILDLLNDQGRLGRGTIILFDELFTCEGGSYSHWPHHEYKAFVELGERTGIQIECFGRRGPNSYAFKIL